LRVSDASERILAVEPNPQRRRKNCPPGHKRAPCPDSPQISFSFGQLISLLLRILHSLFELIFNYYSSTLLSPLNLLIHCKGLTPLALTNYKVLRIADASEKILASEPNPQRNRKILPSWSQKSSLPWLSPVFLFLWTTDFVIT